MPKVVYGFRRGSRLDFRYVNEQDRPESPFIFQNDVNGSPVKLVISWHGFLVYDENVDIAAAMCRFMRYVSEHGCCGRCIPGKNGTLLLSEMMESLRDDPHLSKLEEAIELARSIQATSKCSFAPSSVSIVISFLKEYPEKLHKYKDACKLDYHFHMSAPCTSACPAHIQIPEFIDELRTKKFLPALSIIREHMPLAGLCGRVCPHPCEAVCRRSEIDEPINIMKLKQSAWNYEYFRRHIPNLPKPDESSGKICAIIGAGPAGLTAAYYLAIAGHRVEIFDMLSEPGGMTAAGIPDFREPRAHLRYEANIIRNLGVNIHYNRKLGREITLKYLKSSYDAVLLAVGAWLPQDSRIEGAASSKSVIDGIEYLKRVSMGEKPFSNCRVVVVGGGNTAIDCARTAIRFGCDVRIVYRRTRSEMPAEDKEITDAMEEGVKFEFLSAPVRIEEDDSGMKGVVCLKMRLGSPDATGRRSPEAVPESDFLMECDYLIPAIGQKPDMDFITEHDNLEITRWNTIVADSIYYTTSVDGVFAAGDCIDGNNTVVRAIGDGKRAALMIDRYLKSGKPYLTPPEVMERWLYENKIFEYGEAPEPPKPKTARYEAEKLDAKERIKSFQEVEQPFDEHTAALEARRCLRCMRVGMFATQGESK